MTTVEIAYICETMRRYFPGITDEQCGRVVQMCGWVQEEARDSYTLEQCLATVLSDHHGLIDTHAKRILVDPQFPLKLGWPSSPLDPPSEFPRNRVYDTLTT